MCGQVVRGPRRRRKVVSDRREPAADSAGGASEGATAGDGKNGQRVTLVGMGWTAERRVPAEHHCAAGHVR